MARVKDLWATYPERKGKGKRWLAIWINPAGREQSQAFDKKKDAEKHGQRMEADIARGAYIDPSNARVTIEEWCATWLEGYGAHQPSTVRQAKGSHKPDRRGIRALPCR
jgi:hypothetical protein